jgi:hypothetical protein
MLLYDVSKPTKLSLVREQKNFERGDCKKMEKKSKMIIAKNNVKLWLHDFFVSVYDVMPMCENNNGSTQRHLPSWFTLEIIHSEYTKDMEMSSPGKTCIQILHSLLFFIFLKLRFLNVQ